MNWLFWIVVAIIVFFAIRGWNRGLLRILYSLISVVLLIGLILAGALGQLLLLPFQLAAPAVDLGLGLLQLPLGRLGGGLQLLQALGHLLVLGEELL